MKYFYLATFISLSRACFFEGLPEDPPIDCPSSQHIEFGSDTSPASTGEACCKSESAITFTDSSTPHCEAAVTSKCCECTDVEGSVCSDSTCVSTICSFDEYCCTGQWDYVCDDEAHDICVDVSAPIVSTITRTWTCVDGSGSCPQEIHIVDTTTPSVDCPSDIAVASGADTSPDALGSVVCNDNADASPVASFIDSSVAGECPEQLISRSWQCADCVGNVASCVQQISVGECSKDCASVGVNLGLSDVAFAHSCECKSKCDEKSAGSYCHNVKSVARRLKDTYGVSLSSLPNDDEMCESGSCCCSCEDCKTHITPLIN